MKTNNKKYIKYGIVGLIIFSLIGCEKVQNIKGNKVEESVAKSQVTKISSDEAKGIINSEADVVILDVRTNEEYDSGHIENSILIPVDELENVAESELEDKNKKILIYCRSGNRSNIAAKTLLKLGYKNVVDFGGIKDWNGEIVK